MKWMDELMVDGQLDGWIDGWMVRWLVGWLIGWLVGRMDEQLDGWFGRMDKYIDTQMDGQKYMDDGWMYADGLV